MLLNKKVIIRSAIGLFFGGIILLLVIISSIRLIKESVVDSAYSLPQELETKIELDTQGIDDSAITDYCLNLTLRELDFSRYNDIGNKKANCVGYAQFFKSVCNYAYRVNSRDVTVEHVRGYVSFWGVNLCNVAKALAPTKYKDFVIDHDFIEVNFGDHQYYLDPSLTEVLGITIRSKNN